MSTILETPDILMMCEKSSPEPEPTEEKTQEVFVEEVVNMKDDLEAVIIDKDVKTVNAAAQGTKSVDIDAVMEEEPKEDKPKVVKEEKPKVDKEEKPKVDKEEKPKVAKKDTPKVDKEEKPKEKPKVDKEEKPKEKPKVDKEETPKVAKEEKPKVVKEETPQAVPVLDDLLTTTFEYDGKPFCVGKWTSDNDQEVIGVCPIPEEGTCPAQWSAGCVVLQTVSSKVSDAKIMKF